MLDGSVYAPEHDKLPFLRHMEVMARTFRTAADARSSENRQTAAK
jgi:hypothetical protein